MPIRQAAVQQQQQQQQALGSALHVAISLLGPWKWCTWVASDAIGRTAVHVNSQTSFDTLWSLARPQDAQKLQKNSEFQTIDSSGMVA